VADARKRYDLAAPIALGYSNGANIAAAMLLLRPQVLAGAILLRAMVPLAQPPKPDLARKPVLITSGQRDPIIPVSNAAELAAQLTRAGANVQHSVLPTGHELTQTDVTLAKEWMKSADLPEAITLNE
jgi:phospholipase/carboxylesterase